MYIFSLGSIKTHDTIFKTEWLFVRARTDRILAIRTAYDHVTIQVASRDKLR